MFALDVTMVVLILMNYVVSCNGDTIAITLGQIIYHAYYNSKTIAITLVIWFLFHHTLV